MVRGRFQTHGIRDRATFTDCPEARKRLIGKPNSLRLIKLIPVALGLIILLVLAAVNGANDVGKSIASLVRPSNNQNSHPFRKAIVWGAIFSGLGAVGAIFVSGSLFLLFSQGLVRVPLDASFAMAVIAGSTAVVVAGTIFHIPVSSTHAIVGADVFELVHLYGIPAINWNILIVRVLLPMAASPFAALILSSILDRLSKKPSTPNAPIKTEVGILHWLSAAAVSFSRGLNDAPKIAALEFFLLPVLLTSIRPMLWHPYSIVAVAIVAGSIAWGHYVTKTVVNIRGEMDSDKKLRAGLTTAALVSAGAILGAPVSTTHVGAAAEAGVRLERRDIFWTTTGGIILGWVVTFPLAGILAVLASIFLIR